MKLERTITLITIAMAIALIALGGYMLADKNESRQVQNIQNNRKEAETQLARSEDRLREMTTIALSLAQDLLSTAKEKLAETEMHNDNILIGLKELRQSQNLKKRSRK